MTKPSERLREMNLFGNIPSRALHIESAGEVASTLVIVYSRKAAKMPVALVDFAGIDFGFDHESRDSK